MGNGVEAGKRDGGQLNFFNRGLNLDMYGTEGEPSERCGEINFGLEYDFGTQTLKLKIIQVGKNCVKRYCIIDQYYFASVN